MEVHIKIDGQAVLVNVSIEVHDISTGQIIRPKICFMNSVAIGIGASMTNISSPMNAAGVTMKRRKIGFVVKKLFGRSRQR
jgi:hypothetical protein